MRERERGRAVAVACLPGSSSLPYLSLEPKISKCSISFIDPLPLKQLVAVAVAVSELTTYNVLLVDST